MKDGAVAAIQEAIDLVRRAEDEAPSVFLIGPDHWAYGAAKQMAEKQEADQ